MTKQHTESAGKIESHRQIIAEKVGAVGDNIHIQHQDLSSVQIATINIYNYRDQLDPDDRRIGSPVAGNPYKGLAHFGPQDASLFFGREEAIQSLSSNISKNAFTAVIGPSGSGKSSIVLAGVAPYLAVQGNWLFSYFRASDSSANDPFQAIALALIPYLEKGADGLAKLQSAKELAQALFDGSITLLEVCDSIHQNHPQQKLLLIADQFEELYTADITPDVHAKFIALLVSTLSHIQQAQRLSALSMVVTLRADFLEQATSNPQLATLINGGAYIIGPMEKSQLRQAIEQPALLQNVHFESGLVDSILDDVGIGQGNLPLVEFALRLLWEKQIKGVIGLQAYHEIGRVKGALSLHAQNIFLSLNAADQKAAQRIFTQLVKIGIGTEDTRRIALRTDFLADDWLLLQRFANESNRLVITNNTDDVETAELVHETLIKHWPQLSQWLNESRLFLIWLDDVRRAMDQWHKHKRDTDLLLRGVALGQAVEWLDNPLVSIADNVNNYIVQSQQQEQKLILKSKRRNQVLGATALAVIFILIGLTGYLIDSRNKQIKATQLAETQRDQQLVTQSLFLADLSRQYSEDGNTRLSILLAMEALPDLTKNPATQRPYTTEAASALYTNLGDTLDSKTVYHSSEVNTLSVHPSGLQMITISIDDGVSVWDVQTRHKIHQLRGHLGPVIDATYSPDGRFIVTSGADGTARVWDAITGQSKHVLEGHEGWVIYSEFSQDGRLIATSSDDSQIRLWDSASGQSIGVLEGHSGLIWFAKFSSNNQLLASASDDGNPKIWQVGTKTELHSLEGHSDFVSYLAFSHDGNLVVTACMDGVARIFDVKSGKLVARLEGNEAPIIRADFSLEDDMIVIAAADGLLSGWDFKRETPLKLEGHKEEILDTAFSPDGQKLATASSDGTIRLWDLQTNQLIASLTGHMDIVNGVEFTADGSKIISISDDETARIWDLSSKLDAIYLKGHNDTVSHAAFSPDAKRVVTASWDKTVRIWDSLSGRTLSVLQGHTDTVNSATFSQDGKLIVTTAINGEVRLWDSLTGEQRLTQVTLNSTLYRPVFSHDSTQLAAVFDSNIAKIWDIKSGELVQTLSGHDDKIWDIQFSPDDKRLISASSDKTAKIWDTATGKVMQTLSQHTGDVIYASFSPDGDRAVTTSFDNTARLWQVKSGNEIAILSGHKDYPYAAIFSPSGDRVLTSSADRTANMWDAETGQMLFTIDGIASSFNIENGYSAIAISTNDISLSSSSGKILQVRDGWTISMLPGLFNHNGSNIITISEGNTIKVWDSTTGKVLRTLAQHDESIFHASFSPDGNYILSSSADKTASLTRHYALTDLIIKFKKLNIAPLSADERKKHYLN
jgi:WD40 repeat protein/ABC-type dipeptide/oligopeptide/nickel transport system ATPase component|tara:strand:+ start:28514 stop:32581 length:4068 start_codon:yes stop_codon:yes gene_type:complete